MGVVPKGSLYRVWLGPDQSPDPLCSWFTVKPDENCQLFADLIGELKRNGFKTGVGLNPQLWEIAFNNNCPLLAK